MGSGKAHWGSGEGREGVEEALGGLRAEGRVCGVLGTSAYHALADGVISASVSPVRLGAPQGQDLCSCFPDREPVSRNE